MLIDKREVMYLISKKLRADPQNESLQELEAEVAEVRARVAFLCDGHGCNIDDPWCKGHPTEKTCYSTTDVHHAVNFEPIRDSDGICVCFAEKLRQKGDD